MNSFEEIRIYIAVIKHSNFTVAAKSLGISKQLVSRRIMELESRLGARLLNRTTRKLSPTEMGKIFYLRCLNILEAMSEAEQEVSNQSDELRGLLRIAAPLSYASMMLSPALNRFMLQHPHMEVLLDADNRAVDIIGEGYDMVIRITAKPDVGLVARKLTDSRLVYCCSPSYLEQFGLPQNPSQLSTHRCITHRASEWIFNQDGEIRKMQIHPVLRSNHGEVMREAAIAGVGITCLPEFYLSEALSKGLLIQILEAHTIEIGSIYAMYPQHRQSSAMVRAFADHLQSWFKH